MNHKERAEMLLRKIGSMKFYDPKAIEHALINEFKNVEKETTRRIENERNATTKAIIQR